MIDEAHLNEAQRLLDGSASMKRHRRDGLLAEALQEAEGRGKADCDGLRVVLAAGNTIKMEPVGWLWPGWLARGKLHILAGAPGAGKTTIALALGAALTNGGEWPDKTRAPHGSVVVWSGEDDAADTLLPRLAAMGADLSKVFIVQAVASADGERPFDPATDVAALAVAMAGVPDVELLVVDPIVSAVSGDGHKNAETRRSLQPLVDLAASRRCALIGITHLSKGTTGRDPVERVSGSLAFGALARVVLMAFTQPATDEKPERRLFAKAKINIAPNTGAFAYDLEQVDVPGHEGMQSSSLVWGEAVDGAARDLMAEAELPKEAVGVRNSAVGWLESHLSDGPVARDDVKRAAEAEGFSFRTMQRAMTTLGVESTRTGFGGPATWVLPKRAKGCSLVPYAPASEGGVTGTTGINGVATAGGEFLV